MRKRFKGIHPFQCIVFRKDEPGEAAREIVTRFAERRGRATQTLAADNNCGNGELLHWLYKSAASVRTLA